MSKNNVGICKFCGEEKELIKAHIIPKGWYIGLKDKDRYLSVITGTGKYTISQNGGYDSNILCRECDNHMLGEFDKEGYRVLRDNFSKYNYLVTFPECKLYQLDEVNFDYYKLRKFFISILWRASVSKREEWQGINLGPYEKKAFGILKNQKEYDELFKILIYKTAYASELNKQVFIGKAKAKTYKSYIIIMAGYYIQIIVDTSRLKKDFKLQYGEYFLKPGKAYIIETPEINKWLKKDYAEKTRRLYKLGFVPPKPPGIDQNLTSTLFRVTNTTT